MPLEQISKPVNENLAAATAGGGALKIERVVMQVEHLN
jgi:hypothetical protein